MTRPTANDTKSEDQRPTTNHKMPKEATNEATNEATDGGSDGGSDERTTKRTNERRNKRTFVGRLVQTAVRSGSE